MNISYDHYRIFYYVARYKSFTRAAEVMLCNQPNLTRAVKSLERQIGCTLFERTNKGVQLTVDGVELYEHIRVAFEHIQAGEEAVSAKHNMEHGMVSVGATEIALHGCLLPVLGHYHRLYPGVRIRILNVSTPQALKMADNRLVDLAIVTTPLYSKGALDTIPLAAFREVPICAEGFACGETVTIAELAQKPMISLGAGTSTYDYYVEEFLKHGCPFSADIEAATADQIIPLVKQGLGIGFVPEQFAKEEKGIRTMELTDAELTRQIVLVRKAGHSLPLPARKLVELLQDSIKP